MRLAGRAREMPLSLILFSFTKVGVFVGGCAVLQKTCAGAFFKLCQNILLIQKSTDPKILLSGSSGHIYEQLCLVTFLVSGYFRYVKCIEDSRRSKYRQNL